MKTPRWLIAATTAWVLFVLAGVAWAISRSKPSAREQTSVVAAAPVADNALVLLARAALADGQSVVLIDSATVSECRLTVMRTGARYQRRLIVLVTPGTEQALLLRVRDRLPPGYQARVRTGPIPRLVADSGFYVGLSGGVAAPGQVRFVADTGDCRAGGDLVVDPETEVLARAANERGEAALTTVSRDLGVVVAQRRASAIACPAGGVLATVEGRAAASASAIAAFEAKVRATAKIEPSTVEPTKVEPTKVEPVVLTPSLVAYRSGDLGIGVRRDGDEVVVSVTLPCR